MKSTIIECFYKVIRDARVPANARTCAARALLRSTLKLADYRSQRQMLRDVMDIDVERTLYEKRQMLKQCYEVQVLLWRAIYCYIETRDINEAAYRHNISTADIEWVLSVFEGGDDLSQLPSKAPAHWTTAPIKQKDIDKIVRHKKVQRMIEKLLGFSKSGVVWAFDRAMSQEDLKADLEYKVMTTILGYEAQRRSCWHLVNAVAIAVENEVNNRTRKSTSSGSGGVVEDEVAASGRKRKGTTTDGKRQHGASVQRVVPLTGINEDGEEYDIASAATDASFVEEQSTIDRINSVRHLLRPNVYEYLQVAVLRTRHISFEAWLDQQEAEAGRKFSEDMLISKAKQFFKLTRDDVRDMQGALCG